jgi:predicted MPP superfamily phosphohydrolase
VLWANTALEVSEYSINSPEIPDGFDGFRIAQISDLHNTEFGENNEKLLQMLRAAEPDIIAVTGDLVDSRRTDLKVAIDFLREAVKIAPCYYVTGNHERRITEFAELEKQMIGIGVICLRNDSCVLERNGDRLQLMGVDDCSFHPESNGNLQVLAMEEEINRMQSDAYTILLSHRPELAVVYDRYDVELVLCGHAHGGQFRLPLIGGLYAPDQGFFPKFTAGIYEMTDMTMVVSRGLGNSAFPLRFNNRPEIVVVTLNKG